MSNLTANTNFTTMVSEATKYKSATVDVLNSNNVQQNTVWGGYKYVDYVGYSPLDGVSIRASFLVLLIHLTFKHFPT